MINLKRSLKETLKFLLEKDRSLLQKLPEKLPNDLVRMCYCLLTSQKMDSVRLFPQRKQNRPIKASWLNPLYTPKYFIRHIVWTVLAKE